MDDPIAITDNDELEDGSEKTHFTLTQLDVKLLTSPAVLRAVGGIVLGLAVLAWPDRSDRILARLIGLALVWLAMTSLRARVGSRPREWVSFAAALAALGVGAILVLNPDRSTVFLGRVSGVVLVLYAAHGLYQSLRHHGGEAGRRTLFGLAAAVGAVSILMPEDVFATIVAIVAIGAIGFSILMLMTSLDARTPDATTYGDTADLVSTWFLDRPKSVDARQALYDKILYEGPTARTRMFRFFTLMTFASVIASMGVITDSTAVVIGAMLIAPLMTPLMGMAISLVMGWPNRLTRSAVVAAAGILLAISIGLLLGWIAPTVIDTTTNGQILARSTPTILDMITAVAAGAAGAYGLSRPDVSDSLPGVAIAISLVPPLSVVGIAYSQADWEAGSGALLLFATNMVAILIVGGITFVFTGVTPLARITESQHRVRTAVGVTCTVAVLVFGALMLNGAEIAANTLRQSTVESTVDGWLPDETEHRIFSSAIDGDTVTVVVVGPSTGLPAVDGLADALSAELGRPIGVEVSLVVEERLTATGG